MPSHLSADRPAAQPPGRGSVESLISQTRRLKGDVDAVRRDAEEDGSDHPRGRWQRALCDLALHQLNDLDEYLAQLRDEPLPTAAPETAAPAPGSLLSRVGSAEWNLLTDEASWSRELYQILGRGPAAPPLTLDELPSLVLDEDRPKLTAMVTNCLVDARPIDGEFRIARRDGDVRTVHMMGEPVLDTDGSTASMWAVLRDVSELRRSQREVSETRDSLTDRRQEAQTEHRIAVELQEAVLPQWRGSLRLPCQGPRTLDLVARHLPASTNTLIGGDWYDALELTDGETLLGVGDLTGHGVGVTSNMAMLLGAVRGMAMAGAPPGRLMAWLNQLLDATVQPTLGSAVCCRYRPGTRTLVWAQAGHPAPLLFRDGTGRVLNAPDGVLLGATSGAVYGQTEETLEVGDLLLLHTDGLVPGHTGTAAANLLLGLAPRLAADRTAEDCLRTVVQEFGASDRADNACVLVAKVTS
ncbi:PP2C family protein-serine/threonine phosphatase [Streptomyces azureus]|uniref:Magnesium or manganese-dependent protein phosphatase n=1 Tax=Streptomyces azureus TaxID=146537 RepID=A0A0K8PF08_STRAJ|nr:SpoIIE family protein phosphatase [Streptomyces azureus]GAP46472.1 magnesium or manganese-dependent protein phosphatase [Streptomyces azureus]